MSTLLAPTQSPPEASLDSGTRTAAPAPRNVDERGGAVATGDPPATAISASRLGKCYHVYEKPADRLKQALLRWRRQYYKDFWALRDVSFSVPAGQSIGIIGRNGSGKSTILQIIAGVLAPTTGSVTIAGRVNALLELGAGFNPEFTGRENVAMSGAIQGYTSAQMETLIPRIAAFADIGDFFDQPMKTYSSGMYVRVAFAAAVMMKPDVLVVDEALAVGDIFFQQKCMRHMRDELAGVTKLIVTHDMGSIASLCDRCLVMHKGRLVFDGSPAEAIEFYTKMVHTEEFQKALPIGKRVSPSAPVSSSDGPRGFLDSRVAADAWIDVDQESRGGAGEVTIERVAVTDRRGARLATARPGDRFIAWFLVRSDTPKKDLIFGASLIDRTGTSICGDNSLSRPGHPVEFSSAGRYLVRMEYEWPRLQPATYTVTFGCGEGNDPLCHVIQCWAHNVAAIAGISPDLPIHGVFTNPLREFDVVAIDDGTLPTGNGGGVGTS
ncbi:MAG: ABC transporter ATP-binding protein [Phycisphaerales bacterium]|nr:ABC transporter ATP-binding protein [Phycisphaerales bacterium]